MSSIKDLSILPVDVEAQRLDEVETIDVAKIVTSACCNRFSSRARRNVSSHQLEIGSISN
jgi:hypothetical protein